MPYARSRSDKGKAAALVALLHAGLGAVFLWGLAGGSARNAVEALKSFNVLPPPSPPSQEPPPSHASSAAKEEAAPPDLRAKPAPVVVPPPAVPLPLPSPIAIADERAPVEGTERSAGAAAVAGPGTGAGGEGSGFGGGGPGGRGLGNGGGLGTGARLLSGNLSRRDYRHLRSFGVPSGRATLALTVTPSGRLAACTPIKGSGSAELDAELCALLMGRSRWAPAIDRRGEPVTVQLRYTAVWNRD